MYIQNTENLTDCIYTTQRILRTVYTPHKESYGVYIHHTKNLTECIYKPHKNLTECNIQNKKNLTKCITPHKESYGVYIHNRKEQRILRSVYTPHKAS